MTEGSGSDLHAAPTSSFALASLITGVLGLTFLPFLGGRELATVGLWLGWISIALFAVSICCFGSLVAIPLTLALILGPGLAEGLTAFSPVLFFI